MNKYFYPHRSALYMPGSNERALEKAKTLLADIFIFDFEDAVSPENKEKAIDIYVDNQGVSIFESSMIRNLDPHGTGCFYSSSICALVALGYSIQEAISKSKIYITNAITKSANIGGTVNSLNYNISEFNT